LKDRLRLEPEWVVVRTVCLAIAMLRSPEAREVLLSVLEKSEVRHAEGAIEALALFRGDAALRAKVEAIVAARKEPKLLAKFRGSFGT